MAICKNGGGGGGGGQREAIAIEQRTHFIGFFFLKPSFFFFGLHDCQAKQTQADHQKGGGGSDLTKAQTKMG